ncbi:hypothetical protein LEP1GSC186_4203 [Leptospira noguchii serovar Autumnalis str. ZUN142]|uniref:Uncharacterized protein n=1 Tax=Leptospira noguchii serovar Autumnalis str. ZUN142 TaxID=1085540 RepID=M6U605_9LEPT|nr:hypothetical protein LEP1GSC186_4203 [Leptospira noguchii serovar Autumnalis str. ZUN142]
MDRDLICGDCLYFFSKSLATKSRIFELLCKVFSFRLRNFENEYDEFILFRLLNG